MEEEIAKALHLRSVVIGKAENNKAAAPSVPPINSNPISMSARAFGAHDPKRMSFDENMPTPMAQYSTSPLSSLLSQSPGSIGNPAGGFNPGRRDSLKNMWHLQDFGTTD